MECRQTIGIHHKFRHLTQITSTFFYISIQDTPNDIFDIHQFYIWIYKGYMLLPVILTHGLLAIEIFVKFTRFTNLETSFKSPILLLARVSVIKLVGKKRSQLLKWLILFLCKYNS